MITVEFPELQALARRLEALIKVAEEEEVRDPLDYLLGALHALFLAKRFGFKDRPHALHGRAGASTEGVEYWQYAALKRVRLMRDGKLRIDGAWAAGFYFNSALARVAAVFDRVIRRKARERGLDRPPLGSRQSPSVKELLAALELADIKTRELIAVYDEVTPLKHKAIGLARRRSVTMANAITAFAQMLELLEHPRLQVTARRA